MRAARSRHVQLQPETVERAADLDWAGAGIERELERLQRELPVDAGGGVDGRGARCPEQRHLQAAVLLELEAVISGNGLTDGEADFLAAVVDAVPRRVGAVAREIGRQG